jgi:hypothetical protein
MLSDAVNYSFSSRTYIQNKYRVNRVDISVFLFSEYVCEIRSPVFSTLLCVSLPPPAAVELQKKEFAPWLEQVDNFDDLVAIARAYIDFLHARCVASGDTLLASVWREPRQVKVGRV